MRINFRQGLIAFQKDNGLPVFLNPSNTSGYVSHSVSPTPTVATAAHGASDYLMHFDSTVDLAWGPLVPAVTNYLYFDVDMLTADVTRGITTLPPIVSALEPTSPGDGQHWFDLNTTMMKVWSTARNKWQTKIRVFAGSVANGNPTAITHYLEGTQAALNVPGNPGYIMRDHLLHPLRKSTGEFLTDDAPVHVDTTVGTSGVLVQPVNRIVPVRAGENIPPMSMVYFSAEDTVRLASSNPALIPARVPVGIMLEGLSTGDVGHLSPFGEITYDQWDWTNHAGEPLYIDTNGQITLTRPAGLMAYRVGFVKNKNTVLLGVDAETFPQVYTADTSSLIITGNSPVAISDTINGLGERIVTIDVPAAGATSGLMTPAQVTALNGLGTRMTTAEQNITNLDSTKSAVGHTHLIANTTGLQAALDSKADVGHNHDLSYAALVHTHSEYTPFGHTHTVVDVTGLQTELNNKAGRAHLNSFAEVYTNVDRTGTFDVGSGQTLTTALAAKSDVVHVHAIADTTGLQAALDGKTDLGHVHAVADVTGLQGELDNRAFVSHTHTISNVTGLQAAIDGKSEVGHVHAVADTTGLQAALDGKAAAVHTHAIADTTGLQAALDSKADASHNHDTSYAPLTHTHAIEDVDGLAAALSAQSAEGHTHTISEVVGLQGSLDGKAAAVHTHAIADTTGLQTALDGKAETVHTHDIAEVTDLQTTLDGKAAIVHTHAIADVTGLQTTLDGKTDVGHAHAIADTTGLQAALDGKSDSTHNHDLSYAALAHTHAIADVTNLQTELDGKAATTHVHAIADTTGLQAALDGKTDVGHVHAIADTTGLQTALDGKTDVGHAHAIADVTGLQLELDGKAAAGHNHDASYAALVHTHDIADTTGLQTELDGKAAIVHTHAIADVTGLQTALNNKADSTHDHLIADVTGLQTELDGKAAATHNHDASYSALGHNHDASYAALGHSHDATYAQLAHTHVAADITDISTVTSSLLTIKTITATTYTLVLADAQKTLIRMDSATAASVTIPDDATVNLPVGSSVLIGWTGVGAVSIVGEVGVTVNTPDSLDISKRHGKVRAIKVAANEWDLDGDLAGV